MDDHSTERHAQDGMAWLEARQPRIRALAASDQRNEDTDSIRRRADIELRWI
jgi:hypothetical protein